MRVRVEVLKEDIKRGVKGDPTDCAIARRLYRMGYSEIRVDQDHITFRDDEGRNWEAKTPRKVIKWIDHFDADDTKKAHVEPISFTLDAQQAS